MNLTLRFSFNKSKSVINHSVEGILLLSLIVQPIPMATIIGSLEDFFEIFILVPVFDKSEFGLISFDFSSNNLK